MKIAHVSPFFYPHVGGVESFVGSLVTGLSARGHEVTVITSSHADLPMEDEYHGVRIIRLKPLINLFSTPVVPTMSRTVSSHDFDIIHTHTPPPISELYAARGAKHLGKPLVISYHGDPESSIAFGSLISFIYQNSFGYVSLREASKIIVHTRSYAATSRAIWKYDPVIIPSAVDTERFNPNVDGRPVIEKHSLQGKRIVLFVGRLVPHKGLEYFIRSAEFTDKDTIHLIVGGGDLEKEAKSTVEKLGLGKKVLFTGRVDDSELPNYYAACDVFVLPSVSRLEGFGLVTLEAMSTGKPVLVSDMPGVREVIEPGTDGLLIEPMNPKDISEKINLVLKDDNLRKKFSENARKKVQAEYTWDRIVSKIEDVYKNLVKP